MIVSGRNGALVVAGLGFAVALVARDLAPPLLAISTLGLFDRFVGRQFLGSVSIKWSSYAVVDISFEAAGSGKFPTRSAFWTDIRAEVRG
jgi:hypothetical protein